jgi:hypothetical protein
VVVVKRAIQPTVLVLVSKTPSTLIGLAMATVMMARISLQIMATVVLQALLFSLTVLNSVTMAVIVIDIR